MYQIHLSIPIPRPITHIRRLKILDIKDYKNINEINTRLDKIISLDIQKKIMYCFTIVLY